VTKRLPAIAAALAAVVLAGCGSSKSGNDGVELRVTRDFGTQRLGDTATESKVKKGDTLLTFLQRHHKTTVGGGVVRSIDGTAVSGERNWLFYVNGEKPDGTAAERKLHPGDVVQWDYHDWSAAAEIPATVGAYPEPFIHGLDGHKVPTRIECVDAGSVACKDVGDRLSADGIIASSSALGVSQRGQVLSIFVGPWSKIREIHAARTLEQGPQASGIYAKFTGAGAGLDLLDATGKTVRSLGPGAGIVAATKLNLNDGTTWIVSGVDDAGTDAAAKLLDSARLRDAFAVAALPGGADQRLPVVAAGK
jgi:hypothetical protein